MFKQQNPTKPIHIAVQHQDTGLSTIKTRFIMIRHIADIGELNKYGSA